MGCKCSPEALRILLWMAWLLNVIITTIYYILSFATFYKLLQASNSQANIKTEELWLNTVWRAPLAATLLGGLLVLGFNLFSCIILIKKSINRSGPGFGYGFTVAFCFTLAFFLLLVGLIMDGFQSTVKNYLQDPANQTGWSKYSTELYIATEVLCFICFAMLVLFFLALVIFQSAVSDQLGITTSHPYSPMDPATIALTNPGMGSAPLSGTPDVGSKGTYGTYTAPEIPSDAPSYNNFYSQGSQRVQQGAGEYQATTEYQTTEYQYENEQGYQGDAGYQPTNFGSSLGAGQPVQYQQQPTPMYQPSGSFQQPPAYQPSEYNAAAAFHGQQGAFAAPATHQQL